ncbi:MAG: VanZ family protein [Prosthecobacter sp.]|uniref:VanZ family protein n=1 Tax=Prosthecobacter sp. TaxID=1965333 RepID=UPI003903F191
MQLPRFLSSPLLWRMFVLLWAGILYWLSEQSKLPSPAKFEGIDKLEHVVYFAAGGMCFLLSLRLVGFARKTTIAIVLTVLFCSLVGALDEWHQTFTPGRSGGDVLDWTADTIGGFIGALLAMGLQKWLARDQLEA